MSYRKSSLPRHPWPNRSDSRLLTLDKVSGAIGHDVFRNIGSYLKKGDCLVLNDTKVLPARLLGIKPDTGAKIEVLLLRRLGEAEGLAGVCWEVMVRPGKKAKPGCRISFGDGRLQADVLKEAPGGNRYVRFRFEGIFEEILDELGQMPLPPYIHETLEDRDRYQTVYAREEGSAAAPTAGLHFTEGTAGVFAAAGSAACLCDAARGPGNLPAGEGGSDRGP